MKLRNTLILFFSLSLAVPVAAQFQPEEKPFRIAVLGCIRQYNPAPALNAYVDLKPDISLWIGDNIYADTENDPRIIEESYAKLASFPAFQSLKSTSDFIVTWDDHDYGNNNEGRYYLIKAESKQIFRRFWEMEEVIPSDQPGIYHSRFMSVQGLNLQFIMLDPRYNRDDEQPDGSGDTLGEEQWNWLESELNKDADLRFMVSGYQILLNAETGSETWATYPQARQRLFDLIKSTGAEGVIFIAGDQHYGEVNRERNALDYDAIELQFSGVNQIEDPEKNIYRVSTVASSKDSYAWIDLYPSDIKTDIPHLIFTIKGYDNHQTEVSYRINLNEVTREIKAIGAERFTTSSKVRFEHRFNHLNVRYTMDGSDPNSNSKIGSEISINQTFTLKYALFDKEGNRRSKIHSKSFTKLEPIDALSLDESNLIKGLHYEYAEGTFEFIPDFDQVKIQSEGITESFDPALLAARDDHYALKFTGFIKIEETALYTFSTRSDDGSRLYIADDLVVDNDGSHSARTREGIIALKKGYHPFRLEYFEDYSGQSLKVMMASEKLSQAEVLFQNLFTSK